MMDVRPAFMDLATSIGWAAWTPGQFPTWGTHVLPKCLALDGSADIGRFLEEFEHFLVAFFMVQQPTHLCYEAPWVGPRTHQDTARKLLNMSGFLEYICRKYEVRCYEINNTIPRKHFTGKGRAPRKEMKAMVIDECRRRGFGPKNDDEADALAGLDYMAHRFDIETCWPARGAGPLFEGATE